MALSLVLDCPGFRPGGSDVCEVQCLGIVTIGNASVVSDEIDFHEAGLGFIPVGKGADGNVMLQQGARFGVRTALEATFGFGGCQESINGSRTDGEQSCAHSFIDRKLSKALQNRQALANEDCEAVCRTSHWRMPRDASGDQAPLGHSTGVACGDAWPRKPGQ